MSSLSLQDKTCLVTGASSGIGRGICEILAREGAIVVRTGRNRDALDDMNYFRAASWIGSLSPT